MKMNDLIEAKLKVPKGKPTGTADDVGDAVGDAATAGKAGASSLDDLKYVWNRLTGKKEPKVSSGSPTRIDPTIDELPPTTTIAPPREKVRTPTAKPKAKEKAEVPKTPKVSSELDDITKNAGIPKPKAADDVTPASTPAARGDEPAYPRSTAADDVTPTATPKAADDVAPASTTFKAKSPEEIEAEFQATLSAQRQQELRAAQQAADDLAHQRELAAINQRNQATQREIDLMTGKNSPDAGGGNTPADSKIPQAVKDVAGDFGKKIATGAAYTAGLPVGAMLGGKTIDAIGNATYGVTPVQSTMDAFRAKQQPSAAPTAPAAAPEKQTDNELPDLKDSVDFKEILKLAGLKPITERDLTSGLTKAKPIMTLVENKNLSECGGMGMSTPTNATLNISASASTGEEVAGMLASILQLAGLKQVDAGMMPEVEPMPMMKAMDIMTANPDDTMGAEEPTIVDVQMDDPQTPEDETDIDVVAGDPDLINGDDEEKKTQEGFEDATTKPNPTAMPGYGSWEQKFQRLSSEDMGYVPPGSGNNPLKKSKAVEESVAEVDPVTHGLFKAYEAFKNGQ